MALTVVALQRRFRFNGMDLNDISPEMTPDEVRDTYAATYPQLTTASIEGPEQEGDTLVYTFHFAAGSKG